jgi:diguanylate cyclase (GGDEF)-like protein
VNANDWVIVVSAPAVAPAWSGPLTAGPVALALAGLILLALAGIGFTRHHRQLHDRARTDDLTGLANRLRFLEQLGAALADPATPAAVLLLDLDRFKAVNDTLGHHAGDQLLVEVADRLRRTVPAGQLVARLGGDEFAVLIRPPADADEPARVAASLCTAVRRTMTLDGVPVAISTSIGIALAPQHGSNPARLLRGADVAMYHAKRSASGYTTYSEAQDTHSLAKLGLEAALLTAIEHRQLVLHYQPALDPATGHVHRVEALVRWQHPDLGLIPPAEFIPLAEETGLSHPLTRLVLEMALDQSAQWHTEGLDLQVSVNLSPANCIDPQLPDDLAAMLAARNLPPAALRIEVTEYAALAPSADQVLTRLHQLGVSLALDDFGTGYSSLSHLRRLPVDDIKIDRSFVAALAKDPTDTVIIRSTIDLAHGLGCTVTAEGVEDEHTLHDLHRLGADTIQGYHICRPVPPAELRRWLQQTTQVRPTA